MKLIGTPFIHQLLHLATLLTADCAVNEWNGKERAHRREPDEPTLGAVGATSNMGRRWRILTAV